jgi:ribosomal protein S25
MANKIHEHHEKEAEHHELAAKHHKEAAKHHEAGHHEKAAHHSHLAHAHHLHATEHHEEAVKAITKNMDRSTSPSTLAKQPGRGIGVARHLSDRPKTTPAAPGEAWRLLLIAGE